MTTRLRRPGKPSHAATRADEGYCLWCHAPAGASPYRSPLPDFPYLRETICGPDCPARPAGRTVLTIRGWQ